MEALNIFTHYKHMLITSHSHSLKKKVMSHSFFLREVMSHSYYLYVHLIEPPLVFFNERNFIFFLIYFSLRVVLDIFLFGITRLHRFSPFI